MYTQILNLYISLNIFASNISWLLHSFIHLFIYHYNCYLSHLILVKNTISFLCAAKFVYAYTVKM